MDNYDRQRKRLGEKMRGGVNRTVEKRENKKEENERNRDVGKKSEIGSQQQNYVRVFGIAGEREPDAGTDVSDGQDVKGKLKNPGIDHRDIQRTLQVIEQGHHLKGQMDGQIDRQTDGQTDGQIDRETDRETKKFTYMYIYNYVCASRLTCKCTRCKLQALQTTAQCHKMREMIILAMSPPSIS